MPDVLRQGVSVLCAPSFRRAGDCPPYLRCVHGGCVNRRNFVGCLCQTPRRFTETPYNYFSIYGAMRSVSVSV